MSRGTDIRKKLIASGRKLEFQATLLRVADPRSNFVHGSGFTAGMVAIMMRKAKRLC